VESLAAAGVVSPLRGRSRRFRQPFQRKDPPMKSSLGIKLLGIFLILYGLISLFSLHFAGLGIVMGILALLAGLLLLVGK
jgi:fatty acid desaturase